MTHEFSNKSPRLRKTLEDLLPLQKRQLAIAVENNTGHPLQQEEEHKARQRYNSCLRLSSSTPRRTRLLPKFNGV